MMMSMIEMSEGNNESFNSNSLFPCFILALSYVGSLYITGSSLPRDHPQTIKQRMLKVAIICILGPIFVFWCMDTKDISLFLKQIGIHTDNIIMAAILPLLLTMILFMGPILLYFVTEGIDGFKSNFLTIEYLFDLKWHRTVIVAPVSEELIFRACMLPLLVPKYGLGYSIFIAPLLFGIAHLHHIIEELRKGYEIIPVILNSCFQMLYTIVFGAFSAFVFLRTGHLVGPVLCHSFCNIMGFPDFGSVPYCKYPKLVTTVLVIGLVSFVCLLYPFTNPQIFDSMYWV